MRCVRTTALRLAAFGPSGYFPTEFPGIHLCRRHINQGDPDAIEIHFHAAQIDRQLLR